MKEELPKNIHRSVITNFRLNPTERELLQRLVELDNRTLSEWLREMVRREAERRGVWPPEVLDKK